MALLHEWMFYEVMWRSWIQRAPYPVPWWLQQAFRRWSDAYDGGLFDSKEAALASNALYRYWNMVGVKDHGQESLVGQAGEVEPVYDNSAEHLGEKDKPHYWDDLWALAGLYEAGRLAERLGSPTTGELWAIFDDVKRATADSIRWVLGEQRRSGAWETFVPTGPADVGRLDSTMVGALAYYHPCRLYLDRKLGDDVDIAFRLTLETIWAHFVNGGLEHDAAWNAYAPYLTLQLAHALLLVGDVQRMDDCLRWAVGNAASRRSAASTVMRSAGRARGTSSTGRVGARWAAARRVDGQVTAAFSDRA